MSIVNELTMVEGAKRPVGYDAVRVRRVKLASALQEQLNLLTAQETGSTYQQVRFKRHRDLETDELVVTERRRRLSTWWWPGEDGSLHFSLRYGSARLKIKDGKEVMVFVDAGALKQTLPMLRQEALNGGLDIPLAEAADGLKSRFRNRKTKKVGKE